MNESFHVWTCPLPADLKVGVHEVVASTTDVHGNNCSMRMVFEVVD